MPSQKFEMARRVKYGSKNAVLPKLPNFNPIHELFFHAPPQKLHDASLHALTVLLSAGSTRIYTAKPALRKDLRQALSRCHPLLILFDFQSETDDSNIRYSLSPAYFNLSREPVRCHPFPKMLLSRNT